MMNLPKWRESDTIKFVQLYEQADCLWNYKHPAYRNRTAREKAMQDIIRGMNLPDFGPNELRNKIKNIRSTYQQEVKKIKISRENCKDIIEQYKTNLAWFPIADRFLSGVIHSAKVKIKNPLDEEDSFFKTEDPSLFGFVEAEMTDELTGSGDDEQKFSPSYMTHHFNIKDEPADDYPSLETHHLSTKRKRTATPSESFYVEPVENRKRVEADLEPNLLMTTPTAPDEWYYFGNNIACQLRNMPLESALNCQKQIIEIMANERINVLRQEEEKRVKEQNGTD